MPDSIVSYLTSMGKVIVLHKPAKHFLAHVLYLFLSLKTRINFLSLARHSGQYNELSFRLNFEKQPDFQALNQQYCLTHGSLHFLLAFDLTYLPKAGRATYGTGKYWSGAAQDTLWGLEAGLLSLLDIDNHTAFHLDAIATPAKAERDAKQIDLADHYAQAILWSCPQIQELSAYIALDAYFAKKEIIDRLQKQIHVISRLRTDANCLYLFKGERTGKAGRPRQYGGKIDWQKIDYEHFTLQYEDDTIKIYDAKVYCKFLKQVIRLAYCEYKNEKGACKEYKLYFSTDLNLPAWMIVKYYKARFQQEFLIRDAKQFTGLTHCQARSINKLEYHWNCALTAVNIAKVEHWLAKPKTERGAFSMSSVKTLYHNKLLIERIFDILPESSQLIKNSPQIKQLYQLGVIAA